MRPYFIHIKVNLARWTLKVNTEVLQLLGQSPELNPGKLREEGLWPQSCHVTKVAKVIAVVYVPLHLETQLFQAVKFMVFEKSWIPPFYDDLWKVYQKPKCCDVKPLPLNVGNIIAMCSVAKCRKYDRIGQFGSENALVFTVKAWPW